MAFASSKDALEGNPAPVRVGAGTEVFPSIQDPGAPALSPKISGVSSLGVGVPHDESAEPGRIERLDASPVARLDAGPIERLDASPIARVGAGQLEERDAEVPRACDGPAEFLSSNGSGCYLWVAQLASWVDAQAACLEWGGAFARIDSAEEDQLLARHMTSDSWVGANDRNTEGAFRWADGTVLLFTNWADGQPNNTAGLEDCVAKLAQNERWNDEPCVNLNAYFCERPLR